jgi:hypothetical protein
VSRVARGQMNEPLRGISSQYFELSDFETATTSCQQAEVSGRERSPKSHGVLRFHWRPRCETGPRKIGWPRGTRDSEGP